MREYREPTCANFLKEPHILGVRLLPLLLLTFLTGALQAFGETYAALCIAGCGYVLLRLQARLGKNGSEEALLYCLEKRIGKPKSKISKGVYFEFKHPDTMDEEDQINHKTSLEEDLREISPGESRILRIKITPRGAFLKEGHG